MKILVADCSVEYTGRGRSTLPPGKRAIIMKQDGSVSIHNEVGNKPLNYMKGATLLEKIDPETGFTILEFTAKKESIVVEIIQLYSVFEETLIENDPGLHAYGTETDLQKYLLENPKLVVPNAIYAEREFLTGSGSVDLLIVDSDFIPYAVEVKRTATIVSVDQVRRYLDALVDRPIFLLKDTQTTVDLSKIVGVLTALDFKTKTEELAAKNNILTVKLENPWNPEKVEIEKETKTVEQTVFDFQENNLVP